MLPQPSGIEPQLLPAGHEVSAVQPQTFAVPPPPHVCGEVHAGPQLTLPPHPSGIVPQLLPAGQVVRHPQVTGRDAEFRGAGAIAEKSLKLLSVS